MKMAEVETADAKKPAQLGGVRIMKNVVVISLAFMVQFTAYSGTANLQSSINAAAGLGTASLAAVYAGLITSNIFLPAVVIKWIGCKWSIALSFITYMPYIAAQLYPTFWTLIPAGLIVGFGGGPLWCAKCTYLSVVSEMQSKVYDIAADVFLVRYLGIFFMIFQMNQVWGNLISSLVLSSGNNTAAVTSVNASMIPEVCGANFQPSADAAEVLLAQPEDKIRTLTYIYLACMLGASIIVAIGVNSIKSYEKSRAATNKINSGLSLLSMTLKLLVEPNQLLLITINIFIGMKQAFFGADFTAAFVSCAVGTGTVGLVMMTFGLVDAFGCFFSGYLTKLTGRIPLIISAFILDLALILTLILWRPQPGFAWVMYLIAAGWGISDSLWMVQMNAYYGVLFQGREEAAFANFRLWESVGFIISYIISPYFSLRIKCYVLLILMIVGTLCYFYVEFKESKRKVLVIDSTKQCDNKGCDNIAFSHID